MKAESRKQRGDSRQQTADSREQRAQVMVDAVLSWRGNATSRH
jgi:hypothetical protein